MLYRVHAGQLPPDAWQHSAAEGGRFVGEAGHFFDVFQFLTASRPASVCGRRLAAENRDDISVVVDYADGSVATLIYATQGGPTIGKEYLEVHGSGMSAVMHNFSHLELFGPGNSRSKRGRFNGGKGQQAQMEFFVNMIEKAMPPPTSFEALADTARLTWQALAAAQTQDTLRVT